MQVPLNLKCVFCLSNQISNRVDNKGLCKLDFQHHYCIRINGEGDSGYKGRTFCRQAVCQWKALP